MAKTNFKSIDEYNLTFPAEIKARMESIRKLVHDVVPDADEVISYQIPCFKYHGYLIYYAGFTGHITLSNPWSKELLDHFKVELKKFKVSKSAIQFPNKEDLPIDLIKQIIEFRKEENIANLKKKK